jgi:ketosteroid isomerase-like protein
MNTPIPPVITAYFKAINEAASGAFLACFAEDAIVIDVQREFRGLAAIRKWTAAEVMAGRLSEEIREAREHFGDWIVVAQVDGEFDKTGLPDPLLITHYFAVREGKIATLICLLMRTA